jgi:hypothetical protein
MADWTTVAAAGVAALAGIGGSAATQIGSSRSARKHRREDREKEALQRRRDAYAGLLEVFDRQSVMARFGEPTEEMWGEWRRAYGVQLSLVRLHSSEGVRACTEALNATLAAAGEAFGTKDPELPFHVRLREVWAERHDELDAAWRALLAEMRTDVATSASE